MAKRRTRSQSRYYKEYRKQRNRILATVRRYEKQGLVVNYNIPDIPKRITQASVRRLSKITPKDIQKRTFNVNEYGELQNYNKFKREQKKKIKREINIKVKTTPALPSESEMVITNFRAYISRFNEGANTIITEWLNRLIRMQGEDAVAQMLQDAGDSGDIINYKVVYARDKLLGALASMTDLMDLGTLERETLIENLEYEEDYEF